MARKKVWKTGLDAQAGMAVTGESASMQGSKDSFVVVTPDGTFHGGKHSFICAPSDIRIGGMWTFNDSITTTLPSTIVTPIPVLSNSQPISGVANITSMVAQLATLLI